MYLTVHPHYMRVFLAMRVVRESFRICSITRLRRVTRIVSSLADARTRQERLLIRRAETRTLAIQVISARVPPKRVNRVQQVYATKNRVMVTIRVGPRVARISVTPNTRATVTGIATTAFASLAHHLAEVGRERVRPNVHALLLCPLEISDFSPSPWFLSFARVVFAP